MDLQAEGAWRPTGAGRRRTDDRSRDRALRTVASVLVVDGTRFGDQIALGRDAKWRATGTARCDFDQRPPPERRQYRRDPGLWPTG